ncbi:DUF268 domain-containing protein [Nodosilinea sp. AN01ver1]|uniref:DUF268 domain-containing protein n=1 Tax=Nodosilinea sp. AN01ver1 TaxID=3423362 RepID=UPI003D32297F
MLKETIWVLARWKEGFRPRRSLSIWCKKIAQWSRFWESYKKYNELASTKGHSLLLQDLYPCLGEDVEETSIEPIYFYQDTWAFEKIVEQNPKHHVDIGSHHKFVAFLSKIIPVTMVDIRPLSLPLNTLQFKEGSILDLPFEDNTIHSLSSLCVVEHIGLGRYGDPLDPQGSEKAIAELKRVLCPKGNLYISVPIDDCNRVFFNAHRAFKESYIEQLLKPMQIIERAYVKGRKLLRERPDGFSIGLYHIVSND